MRRIVARVIQDLLSKRTHIHGVSLSALGNGGLEAVVSETMGAKKSY